MRATHLRLLLVLPAVAALVAGVLSGLARLGVAVPGFAVQLAGQHGALMVGGFFGTLIGLERAVALGRAWPYAAPAMSGLATLCLLAGLPGPAPLLMCLAALCMFAACASVWLRQRVAHHLALMLAALAWLLGNLVWALQGHVLAAVALWAAFLILTIAGERLELSRFVPTPLWARRVFGGIVAVLLLGAADSVFAAWGLQLFAAALLALALWLLRYDIARRTVRVAGLTRYMALCLLSGYVWLGIAAVLGLLGAMAPGHALRDAALHALLLGFVLAMVFGHAPVILPALTRMGFRWHRGFYVPLLALHATLGARVLAGLIADFSLRQHAALGNALVIALFFALVLLAVVTGSRRAGSVSPRVESRNGPRGHTVPTLREEHSCEAM
ncbi:MAG: hypothetical protein QM776_14780 [Rhodocyclaceae bacterium]